MTMHRNLRQAFENERLFTIGVIGLGMVPVALLVIVLLER